MAESITIYAPLPLSDMPKPDGQAIAARTLSPEMIEVDPARLMGEVSRLLTMLDGVKAPQNSQYELSELEVNVVVTATGKLAILGSGLEAGATSGIKIRLTRRAEPQG